MLLTGGAALTIDFTIEAESGLLDEKCSFLTLALNIIGETGSEAALIASPGRFWRMPVKYGHFLVASGTTASPQQWTHQPMK